MLLRTCLLDAKRSIAYHLHLLLLLLPLLMMLPHCCKLCQLLLLLLMHGCIAAHAPHQTERCRKRRPA
jgi:hypothetical protein